VERDAGLPLQLRLHFEPMPRLFLRLHTLAHTQASFHTMQYKGRDSASEIDRKLSIIRPGATTVVAP
jgi:hypothetical protein